MYQPGSPALQGDKGPELCDTGYLALQNAPNLRIHTAVSVSFQCFLTHVIYEKNYRPPAEGVSHIPPLARRRSVHSITKHILAGIDHAQLIPGDFLHLLLGVALRDVGGQGVIFLTLYLHLGG